MEGDSNGSSSTKEAAVASWDDNGENKSSGAAKTGKEKGVIKNGDAAAKRGSFDRCFSFVEISIDPGVKSLKHVDSKKLKEEIKKWAKRVAAYARQLSESFSKN